MLMKPKKPQIRGVIFRFLGLRRSLFSISSFCRFGMTGLGADGLL